MLKQWEFGRPLRECGEGKTKLTRLLTNAMAIFSIALGGPTCGGRVEDDDSTSEAAEPLAPDTLCTSSVFNGHTYWFCGNVRNWATARSKCEAAGVNLARIE